VIEANDAGAARTRYEFALMQAKMPRQFWATMASAVEFNPITKDVIAEVGYEATQVKGKPKKSLGTETKQEVLLTKAAQDAAWTNLVSLVHHWNPGGNSSPASGTSIVFFSPNIKHAQMCAMTLLHYMISKTYHLGERPYRPEVLRSHELWSRLSVGNEDAHTLPHVIVMPNIMAELSPTQSSMIAEVLCSSYRLIAATNQTPQQFYETYGVIPSHPFAVQAVRELVPVIDFLKAVQGAQ
jgi:hypothetical protein